MSGSKKIQGQRKKSVDPGIVEPWTELSSGSKYLNCRWIFRSVKLIVGSESVGSAEKSVGSEGKRVGARHCLSPGRELISGSKYLNCRWIFRFVKLIVGSESVGSAGKSVRF